MELTVDQALQQGVAAHKEGKVQEAERLYRAILESQPLHPDANHNLGVLAVSVNKADAALSLFKTALEANPKIEQFWVSYIDALVKANKLKDAKKAIKEAKKKGFDAKKLQALLSQLKKIANTKAPSQELLNSLLGHYQNGRFSDAEKFAISINERFPHHNFSWKVLAEIFKKIGRIAEALVAGQKAVEIDSQDAVAHSNLGNTLQQLGRLDEAEASYTQAIVLKPGFAEAHSNLGNTLQQLGRLDEAKASFTQGIALKPDYAEAHSNLGNTLKGLGRLDEAEASYTQAIVLKPDYAEAHSNLGVTLEELGRLDEAEASYTQAIALKPDYAEAHSNLGNTLQKLGRLNEAETSFTNAIALKPDYASAFWNLHGIQKTIQDGEYWIDKCLEADENHLNARLTKAALKFYRGDRADFDNLMLSEFTQHSYMRSFSWIFSLSNLPELHFHKWYFFDAIIKKSITSKPFYEFGVWRASSFKYLIKIFKKGYGFDTFTGLPEDWDVGIGIEEAGSYSSDGNVPRLKGGEFIVGKFEETLPVFFF